MKYSGKIVLLSRAAYLPGRDDGFLRLLCDDRIELFCVLGVDAQAWEDALDWMCIGEDGQGQYCIVTTSHRDESLAQVIDFAQRFDTRMAHAVQVIER